MRKQLAALRFVILALAAGLVAFVALSWLIIRTGSIGEDSAMTELLLPVLLVMAGVEIFAYRGLRAFQLKRFRERGPELQGADALERCLQPFVSLRIIAAALAESVGMFGGVIYLLGGAPVALVAVAISVVVILRLFPRRDDLEAFVREVSGSVIS